MSESIAAQDTIAECWRRGSAPEAQPGGGLPYEVPKAHVGDPMTAFAAADRAEASGMAQTHRETVLRAVQERPGATSREIAVQTGMNRHAVARRLPELEREGRIRKGPTRKCEIADTMAVTWTPRV